MPIVGLTDRYGENVRYEDVRPSQWEKYGVSPATLVYLKSSVGERDNTGLMTASQWAKGLRQVYLEMTRDLFVKADESVKARLGTSKHATVLTSGYDTGDIQTECRWFTDDREFSGQADQVTHTATGVVIWDTKTGKKYSLKKFKENVHDHEYTWQMNALADLYRLHNEKDVIALRIEWMPADSGRGDKAVEIINVPMFKPGVALAGFREKISQLKGYLDAETAPPFCTEEERWYRWDRALKKKFSMKCAEFCPALTECRQDAMFDGESHPLDTE